MRVREKQVHAAAAVTVAEGRAGRVGRFDRPIDIAAFTNGRVGLRLLAVVPVNLSTAAALNTPEHRVRIAARGVLNAVSDDNRIGRPAQFTGFDLANAFSDFFADIWIR